MYYTVSQAFGVHYNYSPTVSTTTSTSAAAQRQLPAAAAAAAAIAAAICFVLARKTAITINYMESEFRARAQMRVYSVGK